MRMNKNLIRNIVISGVILLAVAFLLINKEMVADILSLLLRVVRPVLIGGLLACVLNRPLTFFNKIYDKVFNAIFNRKVVKISKNKCKNEPKEYGVSRILAMITIYLLLIVVVSGIILIIIPQLVESAQILVDNFDDYYKNFELFVTENLAKYNIADFGDMDFKEFILSKLDIQSKLEEFTSSENLIEMLKKVIEFFSDFFGATADVFSVFVDISFGLIFSVYILGDKKRLKTQAIRYTDCFLNEKNSKALKDLTNLSSTTFSNFILGQLTEALIIGGLCFIGMSIFKFPFALLISTIICIMSIIPLIGMILGTVAGGLIILLVDPMMAIWFVVFIVILNQLESNLIYPRVVGNSVGLPAIWVLFSVVVGGGLFGVGGMIIGIPAVSIIYNLVKQAAENREAKRINCN